MFQQKLPPPPFYSPKRGRDPSSSSKTWILKSPLLSRPKEGLLRCQLGAALPLAQHTNDRPEDARVPFLPPSPPRRLCPPLPLQPPRPVCSPSSPHFEGLAQTLHARLFTLARSGDRLVSPQPFAPARGARDGAQLRPRRTSRSRGTSSAASRCIVHELFLSCLSRSAKQEEFHLLRQDPTALM